MAVAARVATPGRAPVVGELRQQWRGYPGTLSTGTQLTFINLLGATIIPMTGTPGPVAGLLLLEIDGQPAGIPLAQGLVTPIDGKGRTIIIKGWGCTDSAGVVATCPLYLLTEG